jgi:hypothetical protein
MVEVFKTNVTDSRQAQLLVDAIQASFANCTANFDLDDCDRILRVVSKSFVQQSAVIALLYGHGFHAEVLPDIVPPSHNKSHQVGWFEKKSSRMILFY